MRMRFCRYTYVLSRWLPVLTWMGVIFFFSAQPSLPSLPDSLSDTILKKGLHAGEYAILALLAVRALRRDPAKQNQEGAAGQKAVVETVPQGKNYRLEQGELWRAFLLSVFYAFTDEVHQGLVPGRTPRISDWAIDSLGAAIALLMLAYRHYEARARRPLLTGVTALRRPREQRLLAFFFLTISALLWGGSFVAARIALQEISPIALATLRFALASLFFLLLLAFLPHYRVDADRIPRLSLLGLLAITFYFLFQYNGVSRTAASLSSIVVSLSPLAVVALSALFLRERLNRQQITGIVIATLGEALVVVRGSVEVSNDNEYWLGILFLLLNVLAWGLYNIVGKRTLNDQHPLSVTAYITILGTLGLLPLAIVDGGMLNLGRLSLRTWLAIAYLVVMCTIVAYLAYNYALQVVPASQAGIFLYLNPVAAVTLAWPILGETLTFATAGGGIMVIAGVYLSSRYSR